MRQRAQLGLGSPPAAFATDLDGTLTMGGKPLSRELVRVLLRVRRRGVKLILVTGRCIPEAQGIVGTGLFDATVAENGAVLVMGGIERMMAPPGWVKIRERLLPLLGKGCERVIISAGIEKLALVERIMPRAASVVLNKDRLMILPKGVDKGTGLRATLAYLGLGPGSTACLGDGENDLPMFDSVGIRVALDNSVEVLKQKSDFVTAKADGEGAIEAMAKLYPRGRRVTTRRAHG